MALRRRETEVFSLSFLDVICCGFGAIILLLVLSEFGQPLVIERSREDLEGQIERLQAELHTIRGDTDRLERELKGRVERLQRERRNLARAAGEMQSVQGRFSASRQEAAVSNIVENELLSAYQDLMQQNDRLQSAARTRRRVSTAAVGGIPVDSDYVVFLVDTSGSMDVHRGTLVKVMREILDIYPKLKGLQIVDDNGKELFRGTRGRWLTDSRQLRDDIVMRVRDWQAFSDSSPEDGIETVITNYWAADRRISIYVLGDDFNGESIQGAVDAIDRLNRPDRGGRKRVRIHGIGFPKVPFTNPRFSALMRIVSERNDGTFVGLTQTDQCLIRVSVGGVDRCVGGD